MLKRKSGWSVLAALLAALLLVAGCSGGSKSAKETLQDAISKNADVTSYAFHGSLKLSELDIPMEDLGADEAAAILSMFKNAEVSWTGAYRADPMLTEVILKISVAGDMTITFELPIVLNQEKVWIKVPNIPMLPLPADLVGKFIEIDLKELAEEQGQPLPTFDVATSQKFGNDVMGIILKHVDEETYLSKPEKKDAGIADSADVKEVVQLKVTKEQVQPFLTAVIEKIAPEVIDLLSNNEEYRNMLQLTPEDLTEAKKQLDEAKSEDLAAGVEEFNKLFQKFDVVANLGVNGKGYTSYTDFSLTAEGTDEESGQPFKIGLKLVTEMTDINGEVKFQNEQPSDVVTMDQLMELFDPGSVDNL